MAYFSVSTTSSSPSTMTTTTTTTSCSNNANQIPLTEPGCALTWDGSDSTKRDAMSKCCGSAAVISYFNDCGLYCAASGGKSIRELGDCIHDEAKLGSYAEVFCNAQDNATATMDNEDLPAQASASVVSGGDDDDDDKDGKDDEDGEDGKEGGKDGDKGSAATRMEPVSKAAWTIGALLFSGLAVGALQI